MYTLTTFSLSDLARAYDDVQLRGDMGPNSGSSNVVQLNCADFVADLAKVLNIQVTRDVTIFVARRLLKHPTSSSLLQEIRDNMGSFDNVAAATTGNMPPPDESTSDRDLVEYLVETRTGKLY
jgi:hypothetical protein